MYRPLTQRQTNSEQLVAFQFFVTACQCSIIATGVALEALDRCVDPKTLNGHVIFDYSFLEKG
jgi:hypothetical protein